MARWYVGKKKTSGRREAFSSPRTPTVISHGRTYRFVEGPFKTGAGAREFVRIWNAGGQVTQDEAEHSARATRPGGGFLGSRSRRHGNSRGGYQFVVQSMWSDGRIISEWNTSSKAQAIRDARKEAKSPLFEGSVVRVISQDGEFVFQVRAGKHRGTRRA